MLTADQSHSQGLDVWCSAPWSGSVPSERYTINHGFSFVNRGDVSKDTHGTIGDLLDHEKVLDAIEDGARCEHVHERCLHGIYNFRSTAARRDFYTLPAVVLRDDWTC